MNETASISLRGKSALITGGGSGIGKGAALAMAKAGAKIALVDLTSDDMIAANEEIKGLGARSILIEADIAEAADMERACRTAAQELGSLDIVFANAGINGVWAPIEELHPEEFDRTIAVNLRGTFLTIKFAVPFLKKNGGSILVTSSVNGTRTFSNTGATAYSASKAAQVALVKMLAVELGQACIRVNGICPGAIATNIGENTLQRNVESIKIPVEFPEGSNPLTGSQPGTIDQVGQLALFLASDLANHINGEIVYIDGGASLVVG